MLRFGGEQIKNRRDGLSGTAMSDAAMVPAEGSARAAAPIGADVEAVMNGLRADDRAGFCRGARDRK
jgi:hypothetical protein